ncbi:unnamed protein product, partial [Candidula unifasciata]
ASLIIDDDGIIQDDIDIYQPVVQGRWTDSGIGGGDHQSGTSTLHLWKNSLGEDPLLGHDESINISELEVGCAFFKPTFCHLCLYETTGHYMEDLSRSQLFSDDYYKQLHDLGVLIDGVDLSRDSINESDETELHLASHIEGDGNIRDRKDLIGEYLEYELRKEEEENEERRKVSGRGSQFKQSSFPYSQPSSQDISSFFDEADNNDDNIYEDVEGNGKTTPQNLVRENEDVFDYVSGHIFPVQSKENARGEKLLHSEESSTESRVNMSFGQTTEQKNTTAENQSGTSSTGPAGHGEMLNDARYFYSEAFPSGSRPSSRTSHVSVASEASSARQRSSQKAVPVQLASINSQANFSDEKQRAQKNLEKPHQRRLLPQPSSSEPSQSFRAKNIQPNKIATKQEPVKPNHESDSKSVRGVSYEKEVVEEEKTDKPENIHESTKLLHDRLTQEALKRKQATELFQHLQKDYSNLLTKYAQAELTIDQMRFVRMITLNGDSPTPSQAQSGVMSPALSQQAVVNSLQKSPSRGLESFFTLLDGGHLSLENQELMFEHIKSDHDTLRRAYLQVKDEYNVLRRSGALVSELQSFDQNKELEGYLFRLGMRFDEINDTVENNLKERSKQRRPFQDSQSRRRDDSRE